MSDTMAAAPAEGLDAIYQRLLDHFGQMPDGEQKIHVATAISTLRLAMLMLVDAEHGEAVLAFERGEERLHAGAALVDAGAICTGVALVCHRRLSQVQPRALSVQRAGELLTKLADLGRKLAAAGGPMQDTARASGTA